MEQDLQVQEHLEEEDKEQNREIPVWAKVPDLVDLTGSANAQVAAMSRLTGEVFPALKRDVLNADS